MHLKAGGEKGEEDEEKDGEEVERVFEGVRMGEEKREWRRSRWKDAAVAMCSEITS